MIYCPNCGLEMKEVEAPQHYGKQVVIDQCPKCGGLWFDKDEFYKVKIGHATAIEKLDINKLSELEKFENKVFVCPKDSHALKLYEDPYFFKDLQILSCVHCGGFWFNRGEFVKYQAKHAKHLEKDTVGTLAAAILKLEGFKEREKEKEQLQKFLGPVSSASMPLGMIKTGDIRLDILLDIIGSILHRVFLR